MPLGKAIIIVGSSGAGKTTLVDAMLSRYPSAARLLTATTRPPRQHERDGVDYHFLTRAEFELRRDAGEFFEWFENYGQLYGSSRVTLESLLAAHPIVFGILDLRGALVVKSAKPDVHLVFVGTGSIRELQRRLSTRPGMTGAEMNRRMLAAVRERDALAAHPGMFSMVIVNRDGHLDEAVASLDRFVSGLILPAGH